ncbi:MAG: 2-amino-4-hydroxy-6-hydroxymethyldihydropteridine diphosphokinase [Verrucomicrobiales bacterium]|nr:2-amino-4-hydroxy-6-hydroxymethyldihydropteridine diphosphokinase [Verrucomicrobiales bacterium]
MAQVGISLGSNLGDRVSNLSEAIHSLGDARSTSHLLVSGLYETVPVDCPPDSPDFFNCVIEIETDLSPVELLDFTQGIERELGRPDERARNAARPVDLDLLYYDEVELKSDRLILPHPRLQERAFVLLPLLEIRPDLEAKLSSNALSDQGIEKIDCTDWIKSA